MATEFKVIFEDLPRTPGRGSEDGSKYRTLLEDVVKRPGQWARIATTDQVNPARHIQGRLTQAARRGNNNLIPHLDRGSWDFRSRKLDNNGKAGVYARYNRGVGTGI